MNDLSVVDVLKQTDLFSSMDSVKLAEMVKGSNVLEIKARETLFDYGSFENSMFVILDGTIEIHRNELVLATLKSPDYIGELSLIETTPRSASGRAVTDSKLLEITQAHYDTYIRNDPHALAVIMRTLSARIRKTNEEMNDAYTGVNVLIHDMRNVVCSLGFAQLVQSRLPKDDPNQDSLKKIINTERKLTTMMHQALFKARGHHADYEKTPTDIPELLHHVIETDLAMHKDIQDKTLNIEANEAQISVPIMANAIDIQRVLGNLIINAAQASEEGATIDVRVRQGKNRTTFEIQDHGSGIPEAHKAHIFDEHYTSKADGNGLGLFSCKTIVEKHHQGSLTFESLEGVGTTFVVELPNE